MKVVVELLFDEIIDKFIHRQTAFGRHVFRTQFDLCLTFEYWFRHINGNSTYYTVADVAQLLIFVEELFDGTSDGLAESCLMGTTLDGMLTIDKGVIFLARLVGMGKRNLYILARNVDDWV